MGKSFAIKFVFIIVKLQHCFELHDSFEHCSDINCKGKDIDIVQSTRCPFTFNPPLTEPLVCWALYPASINLSNNICEI